MDIPIETTDSHGSERKEYRLLERVEVLKVKHKKPRPRLSASQSRRYCDGERIRNLARLVRIQLGVRKIKRGRIY